MQVSGHRSSTTVPVCKDSNLQNAIESISKGKVPNECLLSPTGSSHAPGTNLSTTLPLSPLQKLYWSIMVIINNRPTSSFNTTTMNIDSIKLEQSSHFGCRSKLVVEGELVSSSDEKDFSLVAELFDGTQLLGTVEKSNGNHIIIALPHGRKAILSPDGAIYIGAVVNGKRDGIGTMTYPNDQGTFTGSFTNDERCEGILALPDKTYLCFENGQPKNGYGEVIFHNGDTFYGTFTEGKMCNGVLVPTGEAPLELECGQKKVVRRIELPKGSIPIDSVDADDKMRKNRLVTFNDSVEQIELPEGSIFIGSVDTDGKMKNGMIIIKDQLPLFYENGRLKTGNGAVMYPNDDIYAGKFQDGRRFTGNIYCKNGAQLNVWFSYGSLHHVHLKVDGEHSDLKLPSQLKLKIIPEGLPEVCNDYFIRAIVKRAIEGVCSPSFVHCYVERFVPEVVCPESELAEITGYYKKLKEMSMKISDLGNLPSPVIDFGDEKLLSPETDIVVIKATDDKHLEIYSMKYFLQIMAIYMENLIKGKRANPDYLSSPLSQIEVMPNIVLKVEIGKYADSFNKCQYKPIGGSVESAAEHSESSEKDFTERPIPIGELVAPVGTFPDDFPSHPAPHTHSSHNTTTAPTQFDVTKMALPSFW